MKQSCNNNALLEKIILKGVIDLSEGFINQSRVPWSSEPSLKEMAHEVGIDADRFIDCLKEEKSDSEIAEEFDVTEKLIYHLRDHFYSHGVGSIMGQD